MKWLFGLPKMLLVGLMRHPQVLTTMGVFCLLALVWLGGPMVGFEALEIRLIIVVCILFFWILLLLISSSREARGGRSLELSLQKQAEEQMMSSHPDRKEEIKELREELDKAVYALKHSKLGKGRRGTAALYALPWYMFIGPSASGKSTALQHSGLHFPYLGSSGRGIQGVGGTRNCDWWFTSEAVLLDTAGRYVSEEDDREEWFGFLDLLKKNRKKKPINGVIAAISIADLFQADEEELERHAKSMRDRIDELTERLGITFPVYLVFTKCDLIQGFVEFFEDINKREREQIWGCTLSRKEMSQKSSQHSFDAEYQKLCEALGARRMVRLASVRGARKVREVYSFPLQFLSGKEKLSRLVEILFKENPYRDNPIFRGFYFTSGTQEGTPIDRILNVVSRSSGLSSAVKEDFEVQKTPKSYFIKDLFTEVIFPDQFLAGASTAIARQQGYVRVATFVFAILFLGISTTGLALSFLGNKKLIRDIQSVSIEAAKMDVHNKEKLDKNIPFLNVLKVQLDALQRYEDEGIPLRLQLGLYQGEALIPPLRGLYFNRFSSMFLSTITQDIEAKLGRFTARSAQRADTTKRADYYYALLKVYLMLTDPSKLDPPFLSEWFHGTRQGENIIGVMKQSIPENLWEMAMAQVDFYIAQLARSNAPPLRRNEPLVSAVRQSLLKMSIGEHLYSDIKQQGAKRLKPYTLRRAMEGVPQNLISSNFKVPGLYTIEGWRNFPSIMESVLAGSGEVVWVLGLKEMNREAMAGAIERRYDDDYAGYWQQYLESIEIVPGKNLFDTRDKVNALAQANSPIKRMLIGVDQNTHLVTKTTAALLSSGSKGLLKKGKQLIGLGSEGEKPASPSISSSANPVALKFQSLHQFVTKGLDPEAASMIEQYGAEAGNADGVLRALIHPEESGIDAKTVAKGIILRGKNELVQAARNTDKLIRKLDPALRGVIGPLLLAPFRMSAKKIMRAAVRELNQTWRDEVFQICRQNVAGRYPFYKAGEDAGMDDVAELFQPEQGILWLFYERELKTFVEKKQNGFVSKKGMMSVSLPFSETFLTALHQAKRISESLFQRGNQTPAFSFGLKPYPSRGVSESILQMDGNVLRYRNEPQEWYEFTWPSKSGAPGASLQIQSSDVRQARQFTGHWGFFKLLDHGHLERISTNAYRVIWRFKKPDATIVEIKYDLRATSHKNPLKAGLFSDFRCIESLGLNQ